MDYLQYLSKFNKMTGRSIVSFKPYYKWITFNTENAQKFNETVNKF